MYINVFESLEWANTDARAKFIAELNAHIAELVESGSSAHSIIEYVNSAYYGILENESWETAMFDIQDLFSMTGGVEVEEFIYQETGVLASEIWAEIAEQCDIPGVGYDDLDFEDPFHLEARAEYEDRLMLIIWDEYYVPAAERDVYLALERFRAIIFEEEMTRIFGEARRCAPAFA